MTNQEQEIIEYKKWLNEFEGYSCDRITIINHLINKLNYTKYLEIGIRYGECFNQINIEHKDGVDPIPSPYTNFCMTSDEFFENNKQKYDIIFIDGLHLDYQVYNDITNSLNCLSENGTIVCHDMNPLFEICQRKTSVVMTWNGDCWKAFVKLRSENPNLEMFTIDTDFGVAIIRRGQQKNIQIPEELDYDFLNNNRESILNLITIEDFYKLY